MCEGYHLPPKKKLRVKVVSIKVLRMICGTSPLRVNMIMGHIKNNEDKMTNNIII